MGKKISIKLSEKMPMKEELRLDLDKPAEPEKPELLEDLLKYLCPGCTQIAFYTRYPEGAHLRYCPHCNRELDPLQTDNFVVCSEEEAKSVGEI